MFQERVKQIEPGIRLCSFNIEGLQTSKLLSEEVQYTQLSDGEAVKELIEKMAAKPSKQKRGETD